MNQQQLKDGYSHLYKFFSGIPECVFWDFLGEDNFLPNDANEIFQFVDLLSTDNKFVIKEKFRNLKNDKESFFDYFTEISIAYKFRSYHPEFIQAANNVAKPDLKVKIQEAPVYIEVTRAGAKRSAKERKTRKQLLQSEGEMFDVTGPTEGTFENFLNKSREKVRQFSDIGKGALKLIVVVSDRGYTTDLSYFDDKDRKDMIEKDPMLQTIDGLLVINKCEKQHRVISLSQKFEKIEGIIDVIFAKDEF